MESETDIPAEYVVDDSTIESIAKSAGLSRDQLADLEVSIKNIKVSATKPG